MDITIDKINEILSQLKGVRIKESLSLKKRLEKEKIKLISKETFVKTVDVKSVNQKRSSKLKRYWRYVKLIRDSYPEYKTNQIRGEIKNKKQGKKSKIRDVIWQNPSG